MDKLIYLDNNSTTKIDDRIIEAMLPFFREWYGNASSSHYFGIGIKNKIKSARSQIAHFIGGFDEEIIFTSGATEAINIAVKGLAFSNTNSRKKIVTIETEHKAILDTYKHLEKYGFESIYVPVNSDGLINFDLFRSFVNDSVLLVSVMLVNNETGVIQDIKQLANYAKEQGAYFFCDATQAIGKMPVNVEALNTDFLCLSGHKFHAPKGVGVLYISSKSNLKRKLLPHQHGGGHEDGLRSGTIDTPHIIGLARACEISSLEMGQNSEQISRLRNELEKGLLSIKGSFVNGNIIQRIHNTSNICFPGQDANIIIGRMKNFAFSNGSACTSMVIEPSHVLRAMGLDDEKAFSAIRFSLSKYNTEEEIEITIREIKKMVEPI